jgi:hypothetical protein
MAAIGGAGLVIVAIDRGIDAIPTHATGEVMPDQPVAGIQAGAIRVLGAAGLASRNAMIAVATAVTPFRRVPAAAKSGTLRATGTECVVRTTFDSIQNVLAERLATMPVLIQTADLRQPGAACVTVDALVWIGATGVVATFGIARPDLALVVATGRSISRITLGEPLGTDTSRAIPMLTAGAFPGFGRRSRAATGFDIAIEGGAAGKRRAAEPQKSLEDRAAVGAFGQRLGDRIESTIVHRPQPPLLLARGLRLGTTKSK